MDLHIIWQSTTVKPDNGQEELLLKVLERAGITGEVQCRVFKNGVRTSGQQRGIRGMHVVHIVPAGNALKIRSQPEGTSGPAQELLIYTPQNLPVHELDRRVREALTLIKDEKKATKKAAALIATSATSTDHVVVEMQGHDLETRIEELKREIKTLQSNRDRLEATSHNQAAEVEHFNTQIKDLTAQRDTADRARRETDRDINGVLACIRIANKELQHLQGRRQKAATAEAQAVLDLLGGVSPAALQIIQQKLAEQGKKEDQVA